jgi:hypothetical protein
MIDIIPTFSDFDIQTLFVSDIFCSRGDGRTTEARANSVFGCSEVIFRSCVDIKDDRIDIYLGGTGSSSRGSEQKHSIIVFSIHPTNVIKFASACDCILGIANSCAHRCRLLMELRKLQNKAAGIPQNKERGMTVVRRLEGLTAISKTSIQEKQKRSKKRSKPTSSKTLEKRRCSNASQSNGQETTFQPLIEFLPVSKRAEKLNKPNLLLIRDAMRERYQQAELPPSQRWPTTVHKRQEIIDALLTMAEQLRRSSHGSVNTDDPEEG